MRFVPFTAVRLIGVLLVAALIGRGPPRPPMPLSTRADGLSAVLHARLDSIPATFAFSVRDLRQPDGAPGFAWRMNADTVFHAASTMKVPVMVEAYRQAALGRIGLDQPLPVVDRFASIIDGSPFSLSPDDDSDSTLYDSVGGTRSVRDLVELMITRSSNLATNLLVGWATPDSINRTLTALGVRGVTVLRGVEDIKAFRAGQNNTVTADGLADLMTAIARDRVVNHETSEAIRQVLLQQEFRDLIPAKLPDGVRVANKTGWITDHQHDAALIYPPGAAEPSFVIVALSRSHGASETDVRRAIQDAALLIYNAMATK